MTDWRIIRGDSIWQWGRDMGNGWSASVSDHSGAAAPYRPEPEYHIGAICRNRIITGPIFRGESFEAAKRRAELLTLEQPVLACGHEWDIRVQACMLCRIKEPSTPGLDPHPSL